jgi:hypothetical protein
LQVFHDVEGDDSWRRQIRGLLQRVVFEPEDVEVDLVALDQVGVVEGFEALGFLALMA